MLGEKDKIGLLSVTAISTTCIIGSGWLFSSYLGAKIAGAGVYFSWLLTLIFFLLMALVIGEIALIYPVRGIISRMGAIAYNRYFGVIFSFAIWLELIGSIPGEAQASVQYLTGISPHWANILMVQDNLTPVGLFLTFVFLILFWAANMFGIKLFAKINNSISIIKVLFPSLIAILIISMSFHSANFTAFHGSLVPYGFNSIILAMTSTGMIYSFNGFQVCASFASEVKNPRRNLILGMIISIVFCFLVYILLQTSFIGAMDTKTIANNGWHTLIFTSPFAQITTMLGLNVITIILYVDACISPSGTAISFVGGGSRVLFSMASEKQMPRIFAILDTKFNYEKRATIFNFMIAVIFLFLFHGWAVLINFITALIILMYMICPLSLMAIRVGQENSATTGYRLPMAWFICAFLFIAQSMFFAFIGLNDMIGLAAAMTILMIIFLMINIPQEKENKIADILQISLPFVVYLWLLTLLIFLGPTNYGGIDAINYQWFYSIYILIALIAYMFFISKKFVVKCQKIRLKDNVKIVE
ncbi:MAG: hypothetical protein RL017_700 [Pseudomonadota bacterium]|jgi:amino acid transporter|nr:APC family permease [Burkholderiales bacterium]